MTIAGRNLNFATQSIAWNIQIPPEEGMKPLVVFNPHAWASKVNVEIEAGRIPQGAVLLDDEDNPIPFQLVQSAATAGGRFRVALVADLPPMGYRTYRLAIRPAAAAVESIQASDTVLENAHFRLEIDSVSGHILSLRDKRLQLEVFESHAARPLVIDDASDTWSHNVFRFDKVAGTFTPQMIKLTEHGPVKSVIRVVSGYGKSTLIQDFTMYRELDQIDVHVTVDWREQFKMLKLRFPVNLHFMRATYEIPYGHIDRFANGDEDPGQSWIDMSGSSRDTGDLYGLSILNDAKYSFDVNVRDIGLTVLRSPVYAHHIPTMPDPEKQYSFIDQGIQRFTYTLLPHAGSWEYAGTVKRAAELNQPPVALFGTYHPDGRLPQKDSYVSVDQDNVVMSVVKKAEDGADLILRCYETGKIATHATICLPHWHRAIEADFGPCEIKTFRVPGDPAQPVVETNQLEWTE